jgi:hypothetical protein
MAEKGTPVADGASGDNVATRDAFALDELGVARVIQRVDLSSNRGPSPLGNAIRGNAGTTNTIDTLNLSSLPADLTNNLIIIGDNSMLIVQVEFSLATAQDITITPIMYDNVGTPGIMGILPAKTFSLDFGFYKGGANYITPAQAWDTHGAHKFGLHLTQWADSGGAGYVKVYGWVI